MCLFTLPSQDQPPVRRDEGTFHVVYEVDGIKGDTEDAHEEGKLCLICSRHDLFKTHFTMLVSVSHPMSISSVVEYVAPASAVTCTELSPVTEYVAPALADTHAARSPAIEHVVPTLVVFHAAPATVIERSAV